jgi:hypothetical protein
MIDKGEATLIAFLGVTYLLLGAFMAWALGAPQGSLPWLSITLLWPIIGLLLFMAAMAIGAIGMIILHAIVGMFNR